MDPTQNRIYYSDAELDVEYDRAIHFHSTHNIDEDICSQRWSKMKKKAYLSRDTGLRTRFYGRNQYKPVFLQSCFLSTKVDKKTRPTFCEFFAQTWLSGLLLRRLCPISANILLHTVRYAP